jgi:hypothetical protein
VLEARFARRVGVFSVRENRANDEFWASALAQNIRAAERVILQIGPPLVIEVMQKRYDSPDFFVFAEPARVPTDRRFDGQRVFPQAVALRKLGQEIPGVVTG